MLHPYRSLQDLVDGELSDRRRIAVERHVARCASCATALGRLRGLKSSLLGLRNPDPDPALQRRLLAPGFASTPAAPAPGAHGPGGATAVGPHPAGKHAGPVRRRRTLTVAAGGTAVVAGAVLTGAYVMGAEQTPDPGPSNITAMRAGWDSVAPRTPASLDEEQLETLRAGGWYCPELESLGFTLRSAEGITVAGTPTLELVLEKDGDTVTVYEQRKGGEARDRGGPLSPVTGDPVSADGFEHIGGSGRDLWLREGDPWQVVLDSPSVTYTVISDLPASAMPQTMGSLVQTERAQLSFDPDEQQDSMLERIVRGLATITTPGGAGQ
ncbi:anti-sigma factor family protein [Arthrobacter sp. RIT-PI-e]|uniref:anti-sigma factor family protein n=1 Tax=Arthrobacter sp. RIT-PI-e TaxID=1681197 RepID=UPI0006767428|nr:zf-HC2 domain-containing protein [Arthrobacter sp. RIT-PI-e]